MSSVSRGRVSAAAERWRETKRSPFDLFGHSERDKWGELAGGLVELTLVSTQKGEASGERSTRRLLAVHQELVPRPCYS